MCKTPQSLLIICSGIFCVFSCLRSKMLHCHEAKVRTYPIVIFFVFNGKIGSPLILWACVMDNTIEKKIVPGNTMDNSSTVPVAPGPFTMPGIEPGSPAVSGFALPHLDRYITVTVVKKDSSTEGRRNYLRILKINHRLFKGNGSTALPEVLQKSNADP